MATAVSEMPKQQQTTKEMSLKQICVERFLFAIFYCVVSQYFLLTLFVLCINFSIFHPIVWMKQTAALLFSISTWLWSIPLLCVVIVHGIFLAKSLLSLQVFYRSQFAMLTHTAVKKTTFLILQMLIGFLTAWLYSKFLQNQYKSLTRSCNDGGSCLSEKHLFITVGGLFSGAFYFIKEHSRHTVTFPVVQQKKYVRIRACLWEILCTSMPRAFQPTLVYLMVYTLIRTPLMGRIEGLFRLDQDSAAGYFEIITDFKLLLFVWLLLAQVLVNMNLMRALFEIFVTERKEFAIPSLANVINESSGGEVSLVEGLAADKIQIIQQLAALDFYNLADSIDGQRRQQFFELSIPGGHPYNWKQLCEQSLRLIKNYTNAMASAVESENITGRQATTATSSFYATNIMGRPMTSKATEMAEKILIRQYNESSGIRNLMQDNYCASPQPAAFDVSKDSQHSALFEALQKRVDLCRNAVLNAPGFYYLFNESKNSKISFILSQSPTIIWVEKGLAAIVAHSIAEDRYGVVQNDLAAIIKSLLLLKGVLDKIGSSNVDVKKVDRNYAALKNVTRRAIYRIATVFSDYVDELALDASDLRALQNFMYYKEI